MCRWAATPSCFRCQLSFEILSTTPVWELKGGFVRQGNSERLGTNFTWLEVTASDLSGFYLGILIHQTPISIPRYNDHGQHRGLEKDDTPRWLRLRTSGEFENNRPHHQCKKALPPPQREGHQHQANHRADPHHGGGGKENTAERHVSQHRTKVKLPFTG